MAKADPRPCPNGAEGQSRLAAEAQFKAQRLSPGHSPKKRLWMLLKWFWMHVHIGRAGSPLPRIICEHIAQLKHPEEQIDQIPV